MKCPNNIDVQPNKDDFYKIRQLPGVIGCVDGTRVWIITPRDHEANFVNRKGYDSLNVQVICDANVKWTNLVARWHGSAHDSRIIRSSITWDITENGHTGGYITGDWISLSALLYEEPQYSKSRFFFCLYNSLLVVRPVYL